MKFKVGDRVKAVDNIGLFPNGALGTVDRVDPGKTRHGYFVHFDDGNELWCWTSKTEAAPVAAPVGSPKIVITTDGKTTLGRLYEGNKVVKSAEAKCSPSDAFSFQTGAELAFKRLFETAKPGPTNKYEAMSDEALKDAACDRADLCISVNGKRFHECPLFSKSAFGSCTRYLRDHPELRPVLIQYCLDEDAAQEKQEPPKVDKPKYSKGDKVKILRDRTECGYYHAYAKGETATFLYEVDDTKAELSGRCSNTGDPCMQTVHYDDFVPYTEPKEEPKPEPVKLYCAKSLVGWLTNGKVYESVNGHVVIDDGREFADIIMRTRGYLYPLVKRPAKVGEWVYLTGSGGFSFANEGDVKRVDGVVLGEHIQICDRQWGYQESEPDYLWNFMFGEYLVLDGYQPEEKKPEEKKPEFYNGKVVCVAKGYENSVPIGCFVTGKIYLVQDGRVTGENGYTSNWQYVSVEKLSAGIGWTFIEYKGEA